MTTYDKLIAADLDSLGSESRQQLRTIDAALTAIGVSRGGRVMRSPGESPAPGGGELALLRLASVFAHRVARAAGGAMAVACAVALLVILRNPFGYDVEESSPGAFRYIVGRWWSGLLDGGGVSIAAFAGVLLAGAYVVAGRTAERAFERRLQRAIDGGQGAQDPLEVARRLVRRADGWSTAFAIAGPTSIAVLFGVVMFVVGAASWGSFWFTGYSVGDLFEARLRDLTIAIPVVVLAAFAVGRACTGDPRCARGLRWCRALEHPATVPIGSVLGLATLLVGLSFDSGIGFPMPLDRLDSTSALRSVLTATGGAAIFLVTAGVTLRRRGREQARAGL